MNIINDLITTKIAGLIKIFIPADQVAKYTSQLNTVLGAVDVLKEIDTQNLPITAQTHGLVNVLREDVPETSLNMNEYPNTQNYHNGYFVVDRVL